MFSGQDKPHHWKPGERITSSRLNEGVNHLSRLVAENRNLNARIFNLETTIRSLVPTGFKFLQITAQTQFDSDDDKNRWYYTTKEVYKIGKGYDTIGQSKADRWKAVENGWSGRAYNLMENMNDGLTVEGHGVNIEGGDYPDGFSVQPIAVGAIVPAWILTIDTSGKPYNEAWFCMINSDDGTCSA